MIKVNTSKDTKHKYHDPSPCTDTWEFWVPKVEDFDDLPEYHLALLVGGDRHGDLLEAPVYSLSLTEGVRVYIPQTKDQWMAAGGGTMHQLYYYVVLSRKKLSHHYLLLIAKGHSDLDIPIHEYLKYFEEVGHLPSPSIKTPKK